MLPSLVVSRREDGRWGLQRVGDGGDQGDQLVLAVPVGDLVLHDADVPGPCGVQVLPGPGGPGELLPGAAVLAFGVTRTERQEPSGRISSTGSRMSDLNRHSSAAPVSAAVHQSGQS